MKTNRNSRNGQTMVEYVIIVAVVAIAAIAIFGVLSNTLREKVAGAATALGCDEGARDEAMAKRSEEVLKELGSDTRFSDY